VPAGRATGERLAGGEAIGEPGNHHLPHRLSDALWLLARWVETPENGGRATGWCDLYSPVRADEVA